MSFRDNIKKLFLTGKETDPKIGYDLWSAEYDNQPGNLMLDLDKEIFSSLLKETSLDGKVIADVGCGTGRHWSLILAQQPTRLAGYDTSTGMLEKLREKYPGAETYLTTDHHMPGLEDRSCDLIVSTLTIAHIENIKGAFREWERVIKKDGEIILTDYHPVALSKGARRTFRYRGKTIAVKNHIYPTDMIRGLLEQLGFRMIRFSERSIDDSVKSYYEQQHALALFERFKGVPVIYGMFLKKINDPV